MSKFIEVEKLIAKIQKFSAAEYGGITLEDDVANSALNYVLEEIIPSLQQEHPEGGCSEKPNDLLSEPEVDLEKAARNVYESWMGGTMDDVRRDIVELGRVINTRKGKMRGKTKADFFRDELEALKPREKGLFDDLVE